MKMEHFESIWGRDAERRPDHVKRNASPKRNADSDEEALRTGVEIAKTLWNSIQSKVRMETFVLEV